MDGLYTIVTANIRFDNPADGIHCWEMRQRILAGIIQNHSPTVLGTQEGRRSQQCEFAELLPQLQQCTAHRPWLEERMYPSCYLHRDLRPEASGDAWLSETPDVPGSLSFGSAFPRLCTWVRFRLEGKNFFVVNLHIDHIFENTRVMQVGVLAQEIQRRSTPDDHLIVMGDFNADPASRVRQQLVSALPRLQDPWNDFHEKDEASHHAFTGRNENGLRIDWILLDDRLKCRSMFLDKTRANGIWPSDHFPLVCRFSL